MVNRSTAIILMLFASIPSLALAASIQLSHNHLHLKHQNSIRNEQDKPEDTLSCSTKACNQAILRGHACDTFDNAEITSPNGVWTFVCDTDFRAQDIYPFILAGSFENCMNYCQDYNFNNTNGACAGFVWAPSRSHLDNDCYLKSSVKDAIRPATLHLMGAVLHTASPTIISPIPPVTESVITPPLITTVLAASGEVTTAQSENVPSAGNTRTLEVINSTYLGISVNEEASQYVSHAPAKPVQVASDLLEAGINIDLITNYPLASDTGSWRSSETTDFELASMTVVPRLSRDGGRGTNINGTNVFIFCDTSTYGEERDPLLGYLNGFVSSSVAVDESMNALKGEPLTLVNPLGQWQDDVGRMRGWVPMTTGEESFNKAISGQGYRYAVWPNSSPILLNETHAILYAPLVYLEVDMQDQSSPRYTSLGNTLLLISIDSVYGPFAERLQNQFFTEDQVSWGSIGGIRAWSRQDHGLINGHIYLFGQADHGILLAKVAAVDFNDRDRYVYWNGKEWSERMPPADATSNAFMIDQPVMSMDMVYSPAHRTFIMVYLTPDADNTFYYRYLTEADGGAADTVPPYERGGDENYMDALLTKAWSSAKVLFTVQTPARGYAYAGGLHGGYFGDEDITNGGTKMLCTWTEHTSVDPDKPDSGYAHKSQIIDLGWKTM